MLVRAGVERCLELLDTPLRTLHPSMEVQVRAEVRRRGRAGPGVLGGGVGRRARALLALAAGRAVLDDGPGGGEGAFRLRELRCGREGGCFGPARYTWGA